MKKLLPYLLILPLLSGCSALSAVGGLLPGDGVNANAQVGAENNQSVAQIETGDEISSGDNSTVTKADQSNAVKGTQIINETPWWMIGLVALLAGWAIPAPMVMALGIVNFFRTIFGKKSLR